MKKEIEKVPKYDKVIIGYEDKEVFVSEDGTKYNSENDAIMHDIFIKNKRRYDEVKKYSNDDARKKMYVLQIPNFTGTWYWLASPDDLAAVVDSKASINIDDVETETFQDIINAMIFPGWYLIETDDSWDDEPSQYIYSMPYIDSILSNIRSTFPSLELR